jgi:hypothetical protein
MLRFNKYVKPSQIRIQRFWCHHIGHSFIKYLEHNGSLTLIHVVLRYDTKKNKHHVKVTFIKAYITINLLIPGVTETLYEDSTASL